MNKERIEELVDSCYLRTGYLRKDILKAIITAINETKEEDAEICRGGLTDHGYGNPDASDYADAILASKIKE